MDNPHNMLLFQTTDYDPDGNEVKMVYVGSDIDSVRDFLLREHFPEYNEGCFRYGL